MTIQQVYEKCLEQAQAFRKRGELQERTEETITLDEADKNYAMDFYQVAKWLEETEEINPTK